MSRKKVLEITYIFIPFEFVPLTGPCNFPLTKLPCKVQSPPNSVALPGPFKRPPLYLPQISLRPMASKDGPQISPGPSRFLLRQRPLKYGQ